MEVILASNGKGVLESQARLGLRDVTSHDMFMVPRRDGYNDGAVVRQ
jgi:hypothetical protein